MSCICLCPLFYFVLTSILFRRERNRLHAKKTRDRKKYFLGISDKIIEELSSETDNLRNYLRSLNIINEEELKKSELLTLQLKQSSMSRAKVLLYEMILIFFSYVFTCLFFVLSLFFYFRIGNQMQQEKIVMKKMMKQMRMMIMVKN
jgi:hypothetical protein